MIGMGRLEEKDPGDCTEWPNCQCPRCKDYNQKRQRHGSGQRKWARDIRKEKCHYCEEAGGTIDHIVPISKGGRTTQKNCVPACGKCNGSRGNDDYESFKSAAWKRRTLKPLRDSLKRASLKKQ